jgi:nondiscriminating aspartyl-tRNA synthetase
VGAVFLLRSCREAIELEQLGRTLAADAALHRGQQVMMAGWTHRIRRIGAVTFVLLRDRSGIVQLVVDDGTEAAAVSAGLGVEDVIRIRGAVRAEPRAQGGYEVAVFALEVVSRAGALPFEVNLPALKAGQDLALDHRVISLRHPRSQAIFRLKAAIIGAFRDFSSRHGFIEIQSPKIVATATEGGANLFPVDYLGRRAYLAQSPQFYKQLLALSGFERVFEVGPVYRAEPHNTSRHINEFTSLDWEVAFIESAGDLMDLEETMLREMIARLAAERQRELAAVGADPVARLGRSARLPRVTLAEAQRLLLAKCGKELPPGDLDPEGERLLCELVGGAVFVTDYPVATRPAYAQPKEDCPELTDSFDLLLGGVEVTTGGRRISDQAMLKGSLRRRGLDPEAFGFYVEGFGYGSPPHGGLAIGAERLTVALLGLGNLREATFFPRDINRLTP